MPILSGYRFRVQVSGTEMGFSSISGITKEVETETYCEGGRNDHVLVFPKACAKANTLTLKKGVYTKGKHPFYLVGERVPSLNVEVLDQDGKTIRKRYQLDNIMIRKWEVSAMEGDANQLLIDTFELDYGDMHVMG